MVLEELIVVHVHLGEIDAHLHQVLEVLLIKDVVKLEEVQGVHHELIRSRGGKVMVQCSHDVPLLGSDPFL